MTREQLEQLVMEMPHARLDYPFGENIAVYKVPMRGDSGEEKMFAIINEADKPLRMSLKCDPQLAELLREKYETVLPGYHLSKKHWNTIICTGQVPEDELRDLVRHSYELVTA
jgi:predicted DNA-binding protein (MmcQ/YjbR family)